MLHPDIKWFVHLHSHMPFLALEGISMDWIMSYAELGVGLIANSKPSYRALRAILSPTELVYLENVYLSHPRDPICDDEKRWLDIGCFGAIRPLKNQLLQALAAIEFAKQNGLPLRFHINASRSETGGDAVLKCLRQMFNRLPDAQLVEHDWMEPSEFLECLRSMDLGMQVSLTETFNVVSADYVTAGLPVVASKEVAWLGLPSKARDDDIESIVSKMHLALGIPLIVRYNQWLLRRHSRRAQKAWFRFCRAQVSE
jgi:hypothetical protein